MTHPPKIKPNIRRLLKISFSCAILKINSFLKIDIYWPALISLTRTCPTNESVQFLDWSTHSAIGTMGLLVAGSWHKLFSIKKISNQRRHSVRAQQSEKMDICGGLEEKQRNAQMYKKQGCYGGSRRASSMTLQDWQVIIKLGRKNLSPWSFNHKTGFMAHILP